MSTKLTTDQWITLAKGVAGLVGSVVGIPLVPVVVSAIDGTLGYLKEQKKILDQRDEWTAEQRAERDRVWEAMSASHAWLTDDEGGGL